MNAPEEVSNPFLVHGFIAATFLIIVSGLIFVINSIGNVSTIFSSGVIFQSLSTIIIGIVCVILIPYCFRIAKSLKMIEIVGSESNEQKWLLHSPIFVNDVNHPDEIELRQITGMSQHNMFHTLVTFTLAENGKKRKCTASSRRGNWWAFKN